jgi:ABC-type iron transport system FetAB ATPase subunit
VTVWIRSGSVTYPGKDTPAVRDIDLDLAPGRRVALVGPTGAGKSTVAAVLIRFAELSGGTARLNGRDLAGYDPDNIRAVITGCAADPHIFDTTIRDNLRLARPDASDAEFAAAADRARLLDWISSLPRGWDTPPGTHGTALSGGQRQRLALARARLADPAALVLDEPIAHLDPENGVPAEVPAAATRAELGLYHLPGYIDIVRLAGRGRLPAPGKEATTERVLLMHGLGTADVPVFPGMHEAAAMITGATLAAARAVWTSAAQHGVSIAGGLHHVR